MIQCANINKFPFHIPNYLYFCGLKLPKNESRQKNRIGRSKALRHHHIRAVLHVLGLDGLPYSEPPDGRRRERHRGLDLLGHRPLHRYLRVCHQRDTFGHRIEGYRRGLRHQDGLFHHYGLSVHVAVAAFHYRPDDGGYDAAFC